MSCTASRAIAVARSEIGYHEKTSAKNLDKKKAPNDGAGNFTKYSVMLYEHHYYQACKQGFQWCDQFFDAVVLMACDMDEVEAQRVTCQTGPYGAGCEFSARYYMDQDRFSKDDPKPGDQIFFGYGSFDHTGIVEEVGDGYIGTIEGNLHNQVQRARYSINDSYIMGYGHPFYEEEPEEMKYYETLEEIPAGERRDAVRTLMELPRAVGDPDKMCLEGRKDGTLHLSEDDVRMYTVLYRAGLFGASGT